MEHQQHRNKSEAAAAKEPGGGPQEDMADPAVVRSPFEVWARIAGLESPGPGRGQPPSPQPCRRPDAAGGHIRLRPFMVDYVLDLVRGPPMGGCAPACGDRCRCGPISRTLDAVVAAGAAKTT